MQSFYFAHRPRFFRRVPPRIPPRPIVLRPEALALSPCLGGARTPISPAPDTGKPALGSPVPPALVPCPAQFPGPGQGLHPGPLGERPPGAPAPQALGSLPRGYKSFQGLARSKAPVLEQGKGGKLERALSGAKIQGTEPFAWEKRTWR